MDREFFFNLLWQVKSWKNLRTPDHDGLDDKSQTHLLACYHGSLDDTASLNDFSHIIQATYTLSWWSGWLQPVSTTSVVSSKPFTHYHNGLDDRASLSAQLQDRKDAFPSSPQQNGQQWLCPLRSDPQNSVCNRLVELSCKWWANERTNDAYGTMTQSGRGDTTLHSAAVDLHNALGNLSKLVH